jgi:hypothetical protein
MSMVRALGGMSKILSQEAERREQVRSHNSLGGLTPKYLRIPIKTNILLVLPPWDQAFTYGSLEESIKVLSGGWPHSWVTV